MNKEFQMASSINSRDNGTGDNIAAVPQVFVENNILLNLGKNGYFHMSFPDSQRERDVIFYGTIMEAARDHVVVNNPNNNEWYLIPLLYLNYIVFTEKPVLYPSISI